MYAAQISIFSVSSTERIFDSSFPETEKKGVLSRITLINIGCIEEVIYVVVVTTEPGPLSRI